MMKADEGPEVAKQLKELLIKWRDEAGGNKIEIPQTVWNNIRHYFSDAQQRTPDYDEVVALLDDGAIFQKVDSIEPSALGGRIGLTKTDTKQILISNEGSLGTLFEELSHHKDIRALEIFDPSHPRTGIALEASDLAALMQLPGKQRTDLLTDVFAAEVIIRTRSSDHKLWGKALAMTTNEKETFERAIEGINKLRMLQWFHDLS